MRNRVQASAMVRSACGCETVNHACCRISNPRYGGVNTLAHELGHAYHNLVKAERTYVQRAATPMTLAETASIFCETVVREAALRETEGAERLAILEASLEGRARWSSTLPSRFLFESRVFEGRAARELSVDEFGTVMLDAEKETYR